MKILFKGKPKRKGYSMIMGGLTIIMLFYFNYVLGHNPFLNLEGFIFTVLLIILGLTGTMLAKIVENISFFDTEDKLKRYIISESVKCSILLICLVIIYIILEVIPHKIK